MKYFTQYWQNETWELNRDRVTESDLKRHTSGNTFIQSGVEVGDAIYIITIKKGKLLLCSKVIVGTICGIEEAALALEKRTSELYEAQEHILFSALTPMVWDFEVPLATTKKLKVILADGISYKLKFISDEKLDRQALRGVRQLTSDSAAALDKLLGGLKPIESLFTETQEIQLWTQESDDVKEFESGIEGTKKQRYTTYYERLPENRNQAIKIHGVTCKACDFNFEKTYGAHGKDFIHVHHIKPVSQFEKPKKINPVTDLTVLCPNCHSMVHRYKNKTLSMEELKNLIRCLSI